MSHARPHAQVATKHAQVLSPLSYLEPDYSNTTHRSLQQNTVPPQIRKHSAPSNPAHSRVIVSTRVCKPIPHHHHEAVILRRRRPRVDDERRQDGAVAARAESVGDVERLRGERGSVENHCKVSDDRLGAKLGAHILYLLEQLVTRPRLRLSCVRPIPASLPPCTSFPLFG